MEESGLSISPTHSLKISDMARVSEFCLRSRFSGTRSMYVCMSARGVPHGQMDRQTDRQTGRLDRQKH